MNEDPKPEPEQKSWEDQERVNGHSMDRQKDDSEDLKKDTIDESHVLKWVSKIRIDGKTKTEYWEAISRDGFRKYTVEPHLPFLVMLTHKP